MSNQDRAKERVRVETIHGPSGATTHERERLPAVGDLRLDDRGAHHLLVELCGASQRRVRG